VRAARARAFPICARGCEGLISQGAIETVGRVGEAAVLDQHLGEVGGETRFARRRGGLAERLARFAQLSLRSEGAAEDVVQARRAGRPRIPGEDAAHVRLALGRFSFLQEREGVRLEPLGKGDVARLGEGPQLGRPRGATLDAGRGELRLDVGEGGEGVSVARLYFEGALEEPLGREQAFGRVLRELVAGTARSQAVVTARTREDFLDAVLHGDAVRIREVCAAGQRGSGDAFQHGRSPLSGSSPDGTHV
jgi:hypothetical protein